MNCPACHRQLETVKIEGLEVDVCRNGCGGIWFDNFELQKVDEKHEAAGQSLLEVKIDPLAKTDPTEKRPCPKCADITMRKHFFSVKRAVEIDECPGCGGIWLDAGELRQIRDLYETEDARKKAAEDYFHDVFGEDLARLRAEDQAGLEQARKIAKSLYLICPTYYIPGQQKYGAF